ncbi:hypothetical protein C470_00510 [Halorubrum distributum JCM 13561]|uniref:Uncharacterized protein n=1 Tax=Halorubrum distributum JCM 13561 TaxID=1227483 RepID=M0P5P1_9EURY|nr:hypothetical protein C470_00510 [Halorubrum litoreum JCM 13561]
MPYAFYQKTADGFIRLLVLLGAFQDPLSQLLAPAEHVESVPVLSFDTLPQEPPDGVGLRLALLAGSLDRLTEIVRCADLVEDVALASLDGFGEEPPDDLFLALVFVARVLQLRTNAVRHPQASVEGHLANREAVVEDLSNQLRLRPSLLAVGVHLLEALQKLPSHLSADHAFHGV